MAPLPKASAKTPFDYERDLYELYYKGVPDVYINDSIVKGVEPNAIKAIDILKIIISGNMGNTDDVINLAKIYHFGMHKFERNIDTAEKIYRSIHTDDVQVRQTIKEALYDINKIRTYESVETNTG